MKFVLEVVIVVFIVFKFIVIVKFIIKVVREISFLVNWFILYVFDKLYFSEKVKIIEIIVNVLLYIYLLILISGCIVFINFVYF